MAVTVSQYDHTSRLLLAKNIDFTNMKVELLNASGVFVAAHTAKTSVDNAGAYQVSGNGWTSGGILITSTAITTVTTNDAMLDAADVSVTASGGTIGPAYAALIYDVTGSYPLWHIDFGQAQSAGDTTDFKIVWNTLGILQAIYT